MERDKEDADIIGESSILTYTDLMIYSQQAFRLALKKSTICDIDNNWKNILKELPEPHEHQSVWLEFKEYYDKAFLEKEEDDVLQENKGRAKSATTMSDIQARLTKNLETDTAHLVDSAFSAIHIINPGYTPSVAPQGIPTSMMGTSTEDTITDIPIVTFSPDTKEILASLMRDEITKELPQTNNSTGGNNARDHCRPRAGWDQGNQLCFTHGDNLTHSSKDCPQPKPGHKNKATKSNPMGE